MKKINYYARMVRYILEYQNTHHEREIILTARPSYAKASAGRPDFADLSAIALATAEGCEHFSFLKMNTP